MASAPELKEIGDAAPAIAHASKPSRVHYPSEVQNTTEHVHHPTPGPLAQENSGSATPSVIDVTDDEEHFEAEDYDWSGDDDLVDEELKFEEKLGNREHRSGWGFKRIMTLLFSTFLGSLFLAVILAAPAVLVNYLWYKPNPTTDRAYVKDNISAWLFWAAANMIVSWALAFIGKQLAHNITVLNIKSFHVVDLIPIIARLLLQIFWGRISEGTKTRMELYISVKGTLKPVLYAASMWVSWVIIFENIYKLSDPSNPDGSPAGYTDRLHQVVEFGFFLSLVFCVQKMISLFVGENFWP